MSTDAKMKPVTKCALEACGWRDCSPAEFFGFTPEEFVRVQADARKALEAGKATNVQRFLLWVIEERIKAEAEAR